MNFSKTLISTAAAASLVGAIGFAYAQTADSGTQGGAATGAPATAEMQNQTQSGMNQPMGSGTAPAAATTSPDTSNSTLSNSDSGFQGERAPQADRN